MGKAYVNGIGWLEKQTKTVDITENGSVDITPDRGKVLSGVTVNVDTPLPKEEQEKTVDVSANGSYDILPDEGKVLSGVKLNVETPDKYLDGYNNGYNEGYAVGKSEGDGSAELEAIEAELDRIIGIQEALIIGAKITFTIDHTEYTADEGMTWAEWCNSKYNTIGVYPDGGLIGYNDGMAHYVYHTYDLDNYVFTEAKTDDVIESGHNYTVPW